MPEPTEHDTLNDDQLRELVRQQLQSLAWFGVSNLPQPTGVYDIPVADPAVSDAGAPQANVTAAASKVSESPPSPASQKSVGSDVVKGQTAPASTSPAKTRSVKELTAGYGPSMGKSDREGQLQILADEVAGCELCELSKSRQKTVFGVGTAQPRLVFLGEGPGADEDRQGEPFVGAAGQLLDKIIGAMGLSRPEVYILNTVKCRPPGNRNPNETELAQCWGYAEKQLNILQPEIICCLGSVAARTLLQSNTSISRMRGQFFQYRGSRVVVTYHPAYLLRTPSAKKLVWDDMKMIMEELQLS